jgi:DHA1 family multidrug resistance protein-like MFS transporter
MSLAAERRLVALLAAAAGVEWLGGSALLPLLPVYLRHRGSSDGLVGVVMAAYFLAGLLTQYPLGRLADRIGRRPVLVGGLLVFALGSFCFLLPLGPAAALAWRALQGVGAGASQVAALALVGQAIAAERRGRSVGLIFGAQLAGMAVGPALGSLGGLSVMPWLFGSAAMAGLVACVPVLVTRDIAPGPAAPPVPAPDPIRVGSLGRSPVLAGAVALAVAGGLLIGTYETTWSLLLLGKGGTSWQIGISWTLFALPYALFSWPAGWVADHTDRRWLAAAGMAASAGFAIAYPLIPSVPLVMGLGTAEAVTTATAYPALVSLVTEAAPARALGGAQGVLGSGQTGGTALAALVAGFLFGLAPWVPYLASAAAVLAIVPVVMWLWRHAPKRSAGAAGGEIGQAAP